MAQLLSKHPNPLTPAACTIIEGRS